MQAEVTCEVTASQIEKNLRKQGLSITNQRRQVIAEILQSGSHFDIESLTAGMSRKKTKVGYATVYRTVKILADAGMIKREMLGDNHSHYEIAGRDHGHFVCTSCGRIIELACPTLKSFLAAASEKYDFSIDRHSIELFGRCGDCERKQRMETKERQPTGGFGIRSRDVCLRSYFMKGPYRADCGTVIAYCTGKKILTGIVVDHSDIWRWYCVNMMLL